MLFAACLLAAAPAAAPPPAVAAPGREVPAAAGPAAEAPAPAPRVAVFPAGALYAPYLADPHSPGFGVMLVGVPEVGAAASGDLRTALKLGGSFGLLRVSSRERPERALQVEIAAGFYGQFDIDHQLDNLGWDGIYGLVATAAARPGLQLKAGVMHTSSHVGDEYAERTGRRRIGYTREEAVAGVSWQAAPRWRLYGEAAWGYLLRLEERQQPGRLQAGVERSVPAARGGRWGWYAAADLQAFEERDWRLDAALEVGLTVPAGDRRWRVGAGWYDGRLPIGEFFEDDESYLLLGLWLDL